MSVVHGRQSTYVNRSCRCTRCTEAFRVAQKSYRERRYAGRKEVDGQLIHPDVIHGSASSYANWGCRCDECRQAHLHKRKGHVA